MKNMKKQSSTYKRANDGVGYVEVVNTDPDGHFMECAECGTKFDLRQLDQIAFHETHKHAPDIQYSGSNKFAPCSENWDECEVLRRSTL